VIVAVPSLNGVTTPVEDPTVATAVLLLDHVPLAVVHVSVVVPAPAHADKVPAIDAGFGFTVTAEFL